MNKNQLLMSAAVAGILGASVLASPARAADAPTDKGLCTATSACKGQGACKGGKAACKGQNACKGQGNTASTRGACEKIGKKNKDAKFIPASADAAPAAKTEAPKT